MANIAVVLSGCGYLDGSEIHESVLCLLALARAKHNHHCFAPDMPQKRVVNHLTGQEQPGESRNVLIESARIARGDISPLSELNTNDFDAILLPGGYGAALHLCTFALEGEQCTVNEDLKRTILSFHKQKKPIGATCITPAALAKIFENVSTIRLTLGEGAPNRHLTNMGMEAVPATVAQVVSDHTHKIHTTPCYMGEPNLPDMFAAIEELLTHLA